MFMGLNFNYIKGETPLDGDELEGLLILSISNKRELDEFEQKNIEEAVLFFKNKRGLISLDDFLSEKFIKDLHSRMFKNVWSWAGKFRKTEKNIGVDPKNISVEIKKLLDDIKYWLDNEVFSVEETAIRLKHKMVLIHPFANGNGRYSRLLADLFLEKVFELDPFSWGVDDLYKDCSARDVYIESLKRADLGLYDKLLAFAKS